MRPIHLRDEVQFATPKFLPRLLYGSERVRVFLLCLEAGQALPVRADSEQMLCYLVEGKGRLTIGGQVSEMRAGDFAAAAPGEPRGIEAEERLVALWIHLGAGSDDG